jgi:hypothetical protein
MGKASRRRKAQHQSPDSSRRRDPQAAPAPFVARPFEGLAGETDWVAMREVVPAATASIRFTVPPGSDGEGSDGDGDGVGTDEPREAAVVTVLPLAWPGLHRGDGTVMVALQSGSNSGDASRDVAQVLLAAANAEPGTPIPSAPQSTVGTPRLQDLVDGEAPFEVTVHEGFDFWVAESADLDEDGRASLERANEAAVPTVKLDSVASAYWCRIGERTHIRWILPQDEDAATDALARLHAADASTLGEDTRLLGAFRACGLLVPVWDLDPALEAGDYEDAMAQFGRRFDEALDGGPLSVDERRARSGLLSRQVTLR